MTAEQVTKLTQFQFEQALKRLAEKEPEKFDAGRWANGTFRFYTPRRIADIKQDDIDEILALIGWEYELRCYSRSNKRWGFVAWSLDGALFTESHDALCSDKLSTAKSALIAVVEREYP